METGTVVLIGAGVLLVGGLVVYATSQPAQPTYVQSQQPAQQPGLFQQLAQGGISALFQELNRPATPRGTSDGSNRAAPQTTPYAGAESWTGRNTGPGFMIQEDYVTDARGRLVRRYV